MGRRNHAKSPSVEKQPRPNARRRILSVLVALAGIGGLLYFWHDRPRQLYGQARELLTSNPAAAEKLLERSVEAAGGDYPDAQLLRCRAFAALGRWIEALGGFSLIKEPQRCDPDELILLADEASAAREWTLAEMSLVAARQARPEPVLQRLIQIKYQTGRSQAALEDCDELLRIAPASPFASRLRGRIYQDRKETALAVAAYRQALERGLPPEEQPEVRSALVELLISSGETAAARAEVDRLRASGQVSDALRLKEAYLLRLEGHNAAALAAVEPVISNAALAMQALLLRGMLRLDSGDAQQACDDLSRVVEAQPFNKEAHYKLGRALLEVNRTAEAEQHLQTSRRLTAASAEILHLQAQLDRRPANRDQALRLVELYEETGQPQLADHWRRVALQSP